MGTPARPEASVVVSYQHCPVCWVQQLGQTGFSFTRAGFGFVRARSARALRDMGDTHAVAGLAGAWSYRARDHLGAGGEHRFDVCVELTYPGFGVTGRDGRRRVLRSSRSWRAAMHWSGKRFAGCRWFRPQPAGNPQQNFRRLPATSRPNALTWAFRYDRHSLSRQTPRNSRSHRVGQGFESP